MFEGLNARLRSVKWLAVANAKWKAHAIRQRYHATVMKYSHMPPVARARAPIARVEYFGGRSAVRNMRIFFLGTDEQQDRSGMIQALQRHSKLTWFTRVDGSYGQNDPTPYEQRRANNTRRLLDLVNDLAAKGEAPDVLIAQTWGSLIDPAALSEIKRRHGTFIINISMDDRHQFWGEKVGGEWNGVFPLIPHIDLALTAAPECVQWYEKEGCPALFFPEASDPDIFHPMPELPKVHDVSFVGGRYGVREELVTAIRNAGISVTAYGRDWENGRLATDAVPRLFAQSKIILGVGTIGHCQDFYALKLRDFDGPMSGSCYLTHDNQDLYQLYDVGKELVTYSTVEECVDKVLYLLVHETEREKIARAGRERALRDHSWDDRFGMVVRVLRGSAT